MSKRFLVPLLLPADPAAPMEAATKQYVDGKSTVGVVVSATPPSDTSVIWADTSVTGVSDIAQVIETQPGTAYTVVAADAGKLIRLTGLALNTITLPAAGPTVGQRIDFVCINGQATFVLEAGATWDVPPTPSVTARAIGSFVTAIKMGAASWALTGDLY